MCSTHRAYLLRVQSDVQLPAPPEEGGEPDVRICRRSLSVREQAGDLVLHASSDASLGRDAETFIKDQGHLITGGIYDELYFVVQHGDTIYYNLRKPLADGVLQSYLFGVLLATLLRQRGFLVLHACSVARDGEAVAFVGESGWGKSTLAEYFCQQGYTLLTDDVMAIDAQGDGHPHVIPGYPQIRLRTKAGRHLRTDFDDLPVVNDENEKRFTTPQAFPDRSLPLRQVYLLDPTYASATRTEPVEKRTALLRLINHTRASNLVKAPDFQARLLRQCEHVVRRVPVRRLHRARDLTRLHEIEEQVEQDLERQPAPSERACPAGAPKNAAESPDDPSEHNAADHNAAERPSSP